MKIPIACYRIQFSPGFDFRALGNCLDYLQELGISDIYASPIFRSRSGSEHGYDVVNHEEINPELGGQSALSRLLHEVRKRQMGWLQDIVPNHMAFDKENKMLMDVLENGQASEYFGFFDVDWEHSYEGIRGRILAPFLGQFYGECLEAGDIRLEYKDGGFWVSYFQQSYPVRLESYSTILSHDIDRLKGVLGEEHPDFLKILGILYALGTLPDANHVEQRKNQVRFVKRILWEIYQTNGAVREFLHRNLEAFNGDPGDRSSFWLLEKLLAEQFFRLAFWKVASEEINYRRFFNINDLICLHVEQEQVFEKVHELCFWLLRHGQITGLRVDHLDGLYDPERYLLRLRERVQGAFVVVEKILAFGEEIPKSWPIQGTTGYDFLNMLNGLFCQSENCAVMDKLYRNFSGTEVEYAALVCDKKRLITGKHMAGDIDNLARLLKGACSRMRSGSDLTLYGLRRALVEVMAHFPVYRTYMSPGNCSASPEKYVRWAIERALESNPALSHELLFIQRFLLQDWGEEASQENKEEGWHFVMRFQQLTGPLMAKGLEDTAFYVYNRFVSLNEVGGFPERFGISVNEFHDFLARRFSLWPYSLNATSTHDTKRGEDVRARLNVLSEIPDQWEKHVRLWSRINSSKKVQVKKKPVPDRNDEYFLYQTLIGAFPFFEREIPDFLERLKTYFVKAVREAKVHTAWLKPDEQYEAAFLGFLDKIMEPRKQNPFLTSFLPFQKRIAHYGALNSLSQALLKMTAPGVPDFYQGSELWDLNLVDPDNRRPVDFQLRKQYLSEIRERIAREDPELLIRELRESKEDGRIKLFLIHKVLVLRQANSKLFLDGEYIPLESQGIWHANLVCFARRWKEKWALVVAPRLLTQVVTAPEFPLGKDVWLDTAILLPAEAPSSWQEILGVTRAKAKDRLLYVGDVLSRFPVGLAVAGH
ncbi:MAG: malto-oligosyltrehalose synthase [bacterium]